MSTFAARMNEAKRIKRDARNRGESRGNFRETVKPKPQPMLDELERDIAELVQAIRDPFERFASELHWIVLEMNDPTIMECQI